MLKNFLFIISFLFFSACSDDDNKKILKVGISADYPPFDMMIDGEVAGIDADISKAIADKLGYKLEIKEMDFASLIPAINSEIIDFSASNFSATLERAKSVDFTIPYYKGSTSVVYKDNLNIKSVTDLKGLKVGAQTGSPFEDELKATGFVKLKSLGRIPLLVSELQQGKINALVIDSPQADAIIREYPELKKSELPNFVNSEIVIVLKKDSELTEKFNIAISELQKEGKLNKIITKWFDYAANNEDYKLFGLFKISHLKFIAKGVTTTLAYAIVSTLLGSILGVLITFLGKSNIVLKKIVNIYVSILRGTPLILQLSIVYYAIPYIIGVKISPFVAGIIAFSINSSAYISEHLRAGINAIDKGQYEAAKALGMNNFQTYKLIIFPQALVNVTPSLINEAINLIKESSIISVIGAMDIMRRAQLISSETYDYLTPLIIAGIYYYVMVSGLNLLLSKFEQKIRKDL